MTDAQDKTRSWWSGPSPHGDPDDRPDWAADPIGPKDALERFDALDPVDPGDLTGLWRGRSLPTGHPMDGLLDALGWYGKAFEASGRVHPLLFRRPSGAVVALEPALMPTWIALTWPAVARHPAMRLAFLAVGPVLQAWGTSGQLETRDFRGRPSAALVYDRQPIVDHFRQLDGDRVLGLMTRTGMRQPFFFLLTRERDRIRRGGRDRASPILGSGPEQRLPADVCSTRASDRRLLRASVAGDVAMFPGDDLVAVSLGSG